MARNLRGKDMSNTAAATDNFVKVNGINIHYRDWGGDSPRNLLLAHGQSDHTRDGYAVTAFGADLAEFAVAIGIVPFDLVGASLGGRNGISYAGGHSDQLKHFVTLDYGPEMGKDTVLWVGTATMSSSSTLPSSTQEPPWHTCATRHSTVSGSTTRGNLCPRTTPTCSG